MPKDFAKKPKPRAPKQPPKRQVPAWVWLFTGAILGGFVMFLVHLSDLPPTQSAPMPVAAAPEPKPEKPKQIPKPRFDFYELLKESEVAVPEPEVNPEQAKAQSAAEQLEYSSGSIKKPEADSCGVN